MSNDYWVRDRRITNEYIRSELVKNYIEEFGLVEPTKKRVRFIVAQGV